MSQPNTTSQNPKPPSAAEKNLSLCRYLPRNTPSMSDTATFTRLPAALRPSSSTFLAGSSLGMTLRLPGFLVLILTRVQGSSWHNARTMSEHVNARDRLHALGTLHMAVLLFGFAGLFGKWLALPPLTIVFGRTVVAAAALALLSTLRHKRA